MQVRQLKTNSKNVSKCCSVQILFVLSLAYQNRYAENEHAHFLHTNFHPEPPTPFRLQKPLLDGVNCYGLRLDNL